MHVEYMLNRTDWLAYYVHIENKQQPRFSYLTLHFRLILQVFSIIMVLMAGAAVQLFLTRWIFNLIAPEIAPFVSVVAMVAFIIIAPVVLLVAVPRHRVAEKRRSYLRRINRGIRDGSINMGTQFELTLVQEGLRLVTVVEQVTYGMNFMTNYVLRAPWAVVDSVEVTEYHIFIELPGPQWIWIPRRAFADHAAAAQFLEAIERLRNGGELLTSTEPTHSATGIQATPFQVIDQADKAPVDRAKSEL